MVVLQESKPIVARGIHSKNLVYMNGNGETVGPTVFARNVNVTKLSKNDTVRKQEKHF